jgi:hypothetical protein
MAEPEAPPPHAGEPLTREDVLRLIEEHGGPEGLDLRKAELEDIDLSQANLQGAAFWQANLQGANLSWAKLQGADLLFADLRGASLHGADLKQARLRGANLQGADLRRCSLQGTQVSEADLRGARLWAANFQDAELEDANWGDYALGEENEGLFGGAASVYRALKQRHTEAGMYDIAGEFHYREMEARRKLAWEERRLPHALSMYLLRFLYGYGERPERVVGWAAGIIFGLALVHWAFGTVSGAFWDGLYFSSVSFTALGYGAWAPEPQGWAGRFLGVGEAVMGVFMMALFLVTFTRKMTR